MRRPIKSKPIGKSRSNLHDLGEHKVYRVFIISYFQKCPFAYCYATHYKIFAKSLPDNSLVVYICEILTFNELVCFCLSDRIIQHTIQSFIHIKYVYLHLSPLLQMSFAGVVSHGSSNEQMIAGQ